jgi:DNA-binding PadR family transcriptional regulator
LEKKGYLSTEKRDETEYYLITDEGKRLFDLMLRHIEDSIDFSIKYVSVVFKWLTCERKQAALELMNRLTLKEQVMSRSLLRNFTENIDEDIREPFLSELEKISQNRLEMINKLMEK